MSSLAEYLATNRVGGQLYPLGYNAYFKGPHKGVSATFPQCISDLVTKRHVNKAMHNCFATTEPVSYLYANTEPSMDSNNNQKKIKTNEWGKNVYNTYTRRYEDGFANVSYKPSAGYTGPSGFPALSTLTVKQGLIPI